MVKATEKGHTMVEVDGAYEHVMNEKNWLNSLPVTSNDISFC